MATLLASFVVFAAVVGAMSLGVVLQGRRLRGSCGAGGDCHCSPLAARGCRLRRELSGASSGAPGRPRTG